MALRIWVGKMIRIYRDQCLRVRLAAKPLRWAAVKQRYLNSIEEMIGRCRSGPRAVTCR
jgi:hypothetical protein